MWHENNIFYLLVTGYVIIGSKVLYAVNTTQKTMYIDEIFHVRQCQKYCQGIFLEYDPKITTPPGLYFITTAFLLPLSYLFGTDLCVLSVLRAFNFIVSVLLLILIHKIFHLKVFRESLTLSSIEKAWLSLNLTSLPILFFFAYFFYTDMVSILFVLLTYYLYNYNKSHLAGLVGAFSVLVRQNNVVWFCCFAFIKCCEKVEEEMFRSHRQIQKLSRTEILYIKIIVAESFNFLRCSFLRFILTILKETYCLVICVCFFVYIIIKNGSFVLGDKTAHEAVIHVPQLFYFSLFVSVFSFPMCIVPILNLIKKLRMKILSLLICSLIIAIILYFNTMSHLYLISDNRHYTFYLWKRILGKPLEKFVLVPVYVICMYCIYENASHVRGYVKLGFLISTILCLVPHKLLELRYFIIPYILYRIETSKCSNNWQLLLESVFSFTINFLVIRLYLNFTFKWSDGSIQRLSW